MVNRSADEAGLLAGRAQGAGTPGAVAALVGGVLLIGAVLAGNSLVCVSVASERALQTPTNYFIVSLAAADLLLALLVLPLFVYSEVQGGVWLLSPSLCDVLMALDVMLCTASIFNLCAISIDRFVAVTVPLSYNRQSRGHRQLLLIGGPGSAPSPPPEPQGPGNTPGPPLDLQDLCLSLNSHDPCSTRGAPLDPQGPCSAPGAPPPPPPLQARRRRRAKIPGRERKAMKVLPVVVGAFLVCWTPFFVVHITRALCPACPVSARLVSAVTWLGYVNSALNPVIYTVFNAEFRIVFRKALSSCC
ncbi:PREDICTED: D(4) dopamine receptor [Elephantulus edwardii]|uniref:D(4) dopamine receptor n=1 Tax=Elephantulus edwardii TaxID=28737 RepID=UPI0003F06D4D|nr:PREDICTED: D(4) dopamine receptor [Elephantulus edwardii]